MKVNNALVTWDDLATMGLTAKNSAPTGLGIANKGELTSAYYVDETASPFSTYTSQRCPPYQSIVPISAVGKAIAIAGDNGPSGTSYGIYSSINYGLNWSVLKSFTALNTFSIQSVAASSNFQYITFGGYSALSGYDTFYRSSNYGSTWTSSVINNIIDVAMSDNGLYQLVAVYGASGTIYYSTNYGSTWAQVSGLPNADYKAVAISSTGQYQTFISNSTIYRSADYGASFSSTSNPNSLAYLSMSKDGKYQYITALSKIFRSTNFGASFSEITYLGSGAWGESATSYDGKYVLIIDQSVGAGTKNNVWLSSNYGAGFSTISGIPNDSHILTVSVSPDGKYMLGGGYSFSGSTTYANNIVIRSTDNGVSFNVVSNTNIGWKSINMGEPSYTTTTTTTTAPAYSLAWDFTPPYPSGVGTLQIYKNGSVVVDTTTMSSNTFPVSIGDEITFYTSCSTGDFGKIQVNVDNAGTPDYLESCDLYGTYISGGPYIVAGNMTLSSYTYNQIDGCG